MALSDSIFELFASPCLARYERQFEFDVQLNDGTIPFCSFSLSVYGNRLLLIPSHGVARARRVQSVYFSQFIIVMVDVIRMKQQAYIRRNKKTMNVENKNNRKHTEKFFCHLVRRSLVIVEFDLLIRWFCSSVSIVESTAKAAFRATAASATAASATRTTTWTAEAFLRFRAVKRFVTVLAAVEAGV